MQLSPPSLAAFASDLRYGLLQLRRRPGIALGATLTLALGLAAVTLLFSLLYQALLRPVDLPGFERVVQLGTSPVSSGQGRSAIVSPAEYASWRASPGVLEALTPVLPDGAVALIDGLPQRISTVLAGSGFWQTLEVQPALGRGFRANEPGDLRTAVLSDAFWRSTFAADESVLGRQLVIDGQEHEIVGVLGPELQSVFEGLDVVIPRPLVGAELEALAAYLIVLGRVAPGFDIGQAELALAPAQERINEQLPPDERSEVAIVSLRSALVGDLASRLFLLLGAAAAVLLIACSNVSHLLLARGLARRQELEVRLALGASRARIVRQLLAESLVLALAAVGVALVLTTLGLRASRFYLEQFAGSLGEARVEPRVALFCGVVGIVSLLIAGLWPAHRAVAQATRSRTVGAERTWFRSGLVTVQVAATVVLLGVAGLMIRSSILEGSVDTGFSSGGRLSAQLSLPPASYSSPQQVANAFDELLSRVRAVPGVRSAGVSNRIPLAGPTLGIDYVAPTDPQRAVQAGLQMASPGFDEAAGLTVLRGRWFDASDRAGGRRVAVVNRALARALWGELDVVGRTLAPQNQAFVEDGEAVALQIVGVVENARFAGPRVQATPAAIVPLRQAPPGPLSWIGNTMSFVVAADGDLDALSRSVRSAVGSFDSTLALFNIETIDQRLRLARRVGQLNSALFSVLGALALLLAAVGIYGLTATLVAQRQSEFGLRIALGATLQRLVLGVMRWTVAPVGIGALLGVSLLIVGGQVLRSELFGVDVWDLPSLLAALGVLFSAAALAALLPARRAAAVDPVESLRAE